MGRVFIRNGVCGVEEFFKLMGSESKVAVFLACCQRESASFQELHADLQNLMDDSTLAKRLTEFVSAGILDKLTYRDTPRTAYRVTQKALDIKPSLDLMRDFCQKWLHVESANAFDWVSYTKKLLGSRWNARIIWILFVLRSVRFNDLKNSIEGISFKMLTQQLRYLEEEDVVLRKDFQENPPHIEYTLTPKGESLYEILLLIANWYTHYGRGSSAPEEEHCGLDLSI